MPKISILLLCALAWAALALSANAQMPLTANEEQTIIPVFTAPSPDSLKCAIGQWKPALDFAFRFDAGYVVRCRLGLFEGKKISVVIYTRVTPVGKPPILLQESYQLPEVTPEMIGGRDPRKLKPEIEMSGAFGVGEGDYSVEVLARDDRSRICRKRWNIHVVPSHSQRGVPLAIKPLSVESIAVRSWDIRPSERGEGIRLTVLLDAAPMNPYQSNLRAWDRAFLLESLYSLLRQTPCKSVRVVAFNLEQQREIFRHDQFDRSGFIRLSHVLRDMETTTVSVKALKKRDSPEFLAALANQELTAAEPSDAVIFLGPNARMSAKTPATMLTGRKTSSPDFFYFQYFPWGGGFPDAIQHLTKALDGRTFDIHSPAQLGQAIQKMLVQLKKE